MYSSYTHIYIYIIMSLSLQLPWGTSPCRIRMKCRLFSVSLSVNMAIPPIPECTSSDVRIALNVSVRQTAGNESKHLNTASNVQLDTHLQTALGAWWFCPVAPPPCCQRLSWKHAVAPPPAVSGETSAGSSKLHRSKHYTY